MSYSSEHVINRRSVRYALAIVVVAAAFLIRLAMNRLLGAELPPFITLFPAIFFAAIRFGLGPGILASVLSAIATDYFILAPIGTFKITQPADLTGLLIYVAMGAIMSIFANRYRRGQEKLMAATIETTRQEHKDKLRRATEYRQMALEAAELGAWEFRPDSGAITADNYWRKLFGFDADEPLDYESAMTHVHPDGRAGLRDFISELLFRADEELWHSEVRVVWPDDSIHWVASEGRAFRNKDCGEDQPLILIGVSRDITKHKLAAEAQESDRAKLHAALASMTDAVFISDVSGKIVSLNDAFATFHKFDTKSEVAGSFLEFKELIDLFTPCGEFIPKDERPTARSLRGESATNIEYKLRRKDTGESWIGSYNFSPLRDSSGAIFGSVVVARDISAQKKAEEDLRASEAGLAAAQARAHLGNWEVELATWEARWSDEMCRLYYRDPSLGAPSREEFMDLVHPDDRGIIELQMRQVPDLSKSFVFRSRTNPTLGPIRHLSNTIDIVYDASGIPVRMTGTSLDITQQTAAEMELQQTMNLLQLFIEHVPASIAMFDKEMRYVFASSKWAENIGIPRKDLRGLSQYEVLPDMPTHWREAHRRGLAGEVVSQKSDLFQRPDGSIRRADWELRPWRDATGAIGGIVFFTEDVTDRLRTEEALRESETHYRSLFNSMDEGFCVMEVLFDADGKAEDYRFIEANANFEKQTGVQNPVGRRMREISPAIEQSWFEIFGKIALTGEPAHFVNEAKPLNRSFEVHAYRIGAPEQRRVATVFNEITTRLQAEAAIRQQAELLDLAHGAVMVRDLEGKIRYWNHGAGVLYGYSGEQANGRISNDILATVFPRPIAEIEAIILQDGLWEGELIHTTNVGEQVIVSSRWALQRDKDGQPIGVLALEIDITELKNAEAHVKRLNRVYSVLSDVNQTIVRVRDSNEIMKTACRIAVEKGAFKMAWIGMLDPATHILEPVASSGSVDGYLDEIRIDLSDPTAASGPAAQCFHSGTHVIRNDIENDSNYLPWRDHALERGYLSSAAFPLEVNGSTGGVFSLYTHERGFFEGDEVVLLDEMAMDISYALEVSRREEIHRKAEEELHRRTALLEALVDSSPNGVLVVDGSGKMILQNQRLKECLKLPEDIFENADLATRIQFITSRMKNPDVFVDKVRYLMDHPEEISRDEVEFTDGTTLDRYSSPIKDKANNYFGRIWTFLDITDQRKLEEQFRQAQKMEALGQLTGGIAHDFNNLLTVILGCSEIISENVKENARLSRMATMVLGAAKRGADLTHRMLAFARRQTLQPRQTNIMKLLLDLEGILSRTLSADIEFKIVEGGEDCEANVDQAELENALLNLCLNSRDAMPNGGTLTIATRNRSLDDDYAAQNPDVTPGPYVVVEVSDTGSGITAENLARVFDPFFTTKEVGKGTGLGLSMVYGFVKQSRGHVKIYSEPGSGTSVKLYLPGGSQKEESSGEPLQPFAALEGNEVILLVEDNDDVREFARIQLALLGYQVLESTNGREALKVIRESPDISLLLTDMVMPGGMNGRELAEEACKLRPSLKVLYCSGYAQDAIVRQGLLDYRARLLNKPYTKLELAKAIRQVLNEGTSSR